MALRLDSLADVEEQAPPAERCTPALANREAIGAELGAWIERNAAHFRAGAPPLRARVRLLVSRDGDPAYAELESGSGVAAFDDFARTLAGHMSFRPATHDGRPVDAWIAVPVTAVTPALSPANPSPWP
jgi:TonB family protein